MTIQNQQVIDWNGKNGTSWVANQSWLDRMLAPYGEAALIAAAAQPGEHVLDIGCGAGDTTLALTQAVGASGSVLGLDISEPLLARAAERGQEVGSTARFALADAGSDPLPPAGFDLLFSRFGVMFFDHPDAAFNHMRAALKPDGRVAFACWRNAAENDWVRLPMGAIRDIVPPAPPIDPEAPGPFSFGNGSRVSRILAAAGFAHIELTAFDCPILFGLGDTREDAIDNAVRQSFDVGPLSRALADQPDAIRARAITAVRAAFAERAGPEGVVIDGAAWIVTAHNPS